MSGSIFKQIISKQIKLINNSLIPSFFFSLSLKLLWLPAKSFYWNEFVVADVSLNGLTCSLLKQFLINSNPLEWGEKLSSPRASTSKRSQYANQPKIKVSFIFCRNRSTWEVHNCQTSNRENNFLLVLNLLLNSWKNLTY